MKKQAGKDEKFILKMLLSVILATMLPAKATGHDFVADGIAYNIENGNAVVTYKGYYSSNSYMQTDIVIPEKVTYKDVTYPVTAIGNYAFNQCHLLNDISIPASVTEIRNGSFNGCVGLQSLEIPASVISIGDYALQCRNLKSLSLSCRQIGKDALKGLYSLESIEGPDATDDGRCLIIDGVLRLFAPSGVTLYDLPESIDTIDSYVFSDNTELENITLPSGLVKINSNAFYNCSSLKSLNIPASVKVIESSFFSFSSKSLTTVALEDINSYCLISGYKGYSTPLFPAGVDFVDYDGNKIQDIIYPGDIKTLKNYLFAGSTICSITIEEGVEDIEYGAFRDCKQLISASIPASVSKIGNAVFRGCTRLSDLVYGATDATAEYHVKEDREDEHSYIFTDCPSLTHVELLSSVKAVPEYLFAQSYIKSIAFPASVEKIGDAVFYLSNLEEARFDGTPEIERVFSGCSKLRKVTATSPEPPAATNLGAVGTSSLYVPENSIGLYSEAPGWSSFKNILSEPTAGKAGHIFETDGLRFEITDQDNHICKVTSSETGKDYCGKFIIPTNVIADNGETYSVNAIDAYAFTYTSKLTSITIPNSISTISGIDNTTAGLKEIIVDNDNESYASVDGVLFDKGVTTLLIYPSAKEGPYTVPSTVKTVGTQLMAKINLEELTIADSVEGLLVMSNSPSLKYLKMGAGVTSFSVSNCPALEYLEIGPGVEYIRGEDFGAGYHDLWDTRNIRTLVFADSPDPIKIYTMSVDDGYIEAIPTSKCQHVYIGRDLVASGSPLMQHFSSPVAHVEFGPEVTRLDAQLLMAMRYGTKKITVPTADFWASTRRMATGTLLNYSLYIDGDETPDILITSEKVIEQAFYNANNIKTITLSKEVQTIGANAFNTYPCLETLILENRDPANITLEGQPIGAFDYDKVVLSVPHGTKQLYENAEYWKNFTNIVERQSTGHETTDIPSVPYIQSKPSSVNTIYNLQGQPIDPTNIPHGIYIKRDINGEVVKIML